MFLHVGADTSVRAKDIVVIIDIRTTKSSVATAEFLQIMKDEGQLVDISDGAPKSLVVTHERARERVFLSPISAATLCKRSQARLEKRGAY